MATGAVLLLGERVEESADDGDGRADHALGGHLHWFNDEMFSLLAPGKDTHATAE